MPQMPLTYVENVVVGTNGEVHVFDVTLATCGNPHVETIEGWAKAWPEIFSELAKAAKLVAEISSAPKVGYLALGEAKASMNLLAWQINEEKSERREVPRRDIVPVASVVEDEKLRREAGLKDVARLAPINILYTNNTAKDFIEAGHTVVLHDFSFWTCPGGASGIDEKGVAVIDGENQFVDARWRRYHSPAIDSIFGSGGATVRPAYVVVR